MDRKGFVMPLQAPNLPSIYLNLNYEQCLWSQTIWVWNQVGNAQVRETGRVGKL